MKPIKPEDVKLERVLVENWKGPNGFLYPNESLARTSNANTFPCRTKTCSNWIRHSSSFCESCQDEKDKLRWQRAPKIAWDGHSHFYSEYLDQFFNSVEDLIDEIHYIQADDDQAPLDKTPNPETYLIYATQPIPLATLCADELLNGCVEDFDPDAFIPEEVLTKLHDLNDEIKKHSSKGYQVTNTAIDCF